MKLLECSRPNAKNRVQAGEENLVVNSVKSFERSNKRRTEMLSLSRAERISYYRTVVYYRRTVLCITEGLCGI